MDTYHRLTRECAVCNLRPEILQPIQLFFQDHKIGDLEFETQACVETTSTAKSAGGLLSRLEGQADTTLHTAIVLTAQWLIWVRSGDQSGVTLRAAMLKDIQVRSHAPLLGKDTGLELAGYLEGSKERVQGYIALQPGPAALKFYEAVRQAVDKVNPPPKNPFLRWLSGG